MTGRLAFPDDDWVRRCRAGDLAAWRALYDQHLATVCRVARRLGVQDRDLGDVCQEVFLRVWRGLGGFRGEAQFGTWLYRITINEAARARRARGLREGLAVLIGRHEVTPPPVRPDEDLARARAAQVLDEILGRMRPKQRTVFVLFELEERSLDEIATMLGCPLETVRSRLRHARAYFDRLRRQRELGAGGTP